VGPARTTSSMTINPVNVCGHRTRQRRYLAGTADQVDCVADVGLQAVASSTLPTWRCWPGWLALGSWRTFWCAPRPDRAACLAFVEPFRALWRGRGRRALDRGLQRWTSRIWSSGSSSPASTVRAASPARLPADPQLGG